MGSHISYELMKSFKHAQHNYDMGTITYGVLTPGIPTVRKKQWNSVTAKSQKEDDQEEKAKTFFSGVLSQGSSSQNSHSTQQTNSLVLTKSQNDNKTSRLSTNSD